MKASRLFPLVCVTGSSLLRPPFGVACPGRRRSHAGCGRSARQVQRRPEQEALTTTRRFSRTIPLPHRSRAQFRLGYLKFRLGDYDKSIELFKKILAPPPCGTDRAGLQHAAPGARGQGGQNEVEDPRARRVLKTRSNSTMLIAKVSAGAEVESANYGRALACYQIGKFDEAISGLRANLTSCQERIDPRQPYCGPAWDAANAAFRRASGRGGAGRLRRRREAPARDCPEAHRCGPGQRRPVSARRNVLQPRLVHR